MTDWLDGYTYPPEPEPSHCYECLDTRQTDLSHIVILYNPGRIHVLTSTRVYCPYCDYRYGEQRP